MYDMTTYAYVYIYIYICMYMCMCVYIYIYINGTYELLATHSDAEVIFDIDGESGNPEVVGLH